MKAKNTEMEMWTLSNVNRELGISRSRGPRIFIVQKPNGERFLASISSFDTYKKLTKPGYTFKRIEHMGLLFELGHKSLDNKFPVRQVSEDWEGGHILSQKGYYKKPTCVYSDMEGYLVEWPNGEQTIAFTPNRDYLYNLLDELGNPRNCKLYALGMDMPFGKDFYCSIKSDDDEYYDLYLEGFFVDEITHPYDLEIEEGLYLRPYLDESISKRKPTRFLTLLPDYPELDRSFPFVENPAEIIDSHGLDLTLNQCKPTTGK